MMLPDSFSSVQNSLESDGGYLGWILPGARGSGLGDLAFDNSHRPLPRYLCDAYVFS